MPVLMNVNDLIGAPIAPRAKQIQFEIQTRAPSLNKLYAGVHWSKRLAMVNEFKQLVRISLPDEIVQGDDWPVHRVDVEIKAHFKNHPLDSDNLGAAAKMTIDALKGWVIPDDDNRHLRRVTMESTQSDRDFIIVSITEV